MGKEDKNYEQSQLVFPGTGQSPGIASTVWRWLTQKGATTKFDDLSKAEAAMRGEELEEKYETDWPDR